jgi:glycosyltransferase involved in cell wall biosynthesis
MAGLRVVFICQVVDSHDHIQAGTVRWIRALANKPQVDHVYVITLKTASVSLPKNVSICSIKVRSSLITLFNFYKEVLRAIFKGMDYFFIYQGGPYPVLLLPFKWLLQKPIYQWKAHPYISPLMNFYARYCDTKVFTSTRNAFPLNLPNIRIVGQGIDTEEFCPKFNENIGNLITVGRVSPVKHIDDMIKALACCNRKYGTYYKLSIYGPVFETDQNYKAYLDSLVNQLNLQEFVSFHGAILQEQLPNILSQYQSFLFFCDGALGRSVVEAMSCGLPVISSNPCVKEILPEYLRCDLMVPSNNPESQAERIHRLLSNENKYINEIRYSLRNIVVKNHDIESLMDKILAEVDRCC